ncbi:hypothetical protein LZ554_008658 [Drepanopeziza brunnea f. sp. 'monogermtubi']|nr:hypothetical protein LZ554_008658 [Drepanopeziza brunnea f. sp. 'monogermtubi']
MRIVQYPSPDPTAKHQRCEQLLDQYLADIFEVLGIQVLAAGFLLEEKDHIRSVLEQIVMRIARQKEKTTLEASSRAYSGPQDFPNFPLLPYEIRLCIWELAFGSSFQSRVHCVDERNQKFVSNQPILPLFYISQETRSFYLLRK